MQADHAGAGSHLKVSTDMDRDNWSDLYDSDALHGHLRRIGLLRHGTSGGRASVALAIRLDDGRWVVAETTWRLVITALRILEASPIATEETQ